MKIDILAFAAHPDDAELACGGTLIRHIAMGKTAGIIDLTQGELGTRGNARLRLEEAAASSKILGISVRENLEMEDGFFVNDKSHQEKIISCIRKYRPDIVLTNALTDRHPDHGKAGRLVTDACFLSGLSKVTTYAEDANQEEWRPSAVYHYVQDRYLPPDFVIDISEFMEQRMQAIKSFKSQFFNPESAEPSTPISGEDFIEFLYARAADFGRIIGVKYAEGFLTERPPGIRDLYSLF
jgi:bacillithiol biosynthesis deacetylase BshB1